MKTHYPLQGEVATKRMLPLTTLAIFVAVGSAALATEPKEKQFDRPAIVFLVAGQSLMPSGLVNKLTLHEFASLLDYLGSLAKK